MSITLSSEKIRSRFVRKVEEISGEKIFLCYQCGKCSSACPSTDQMDLLPNQIIRLVQLGQEEALSSKMIWVCTACLACGVECPKGIDIANLAEALRLMHLRKNLDHLDLNTISKEDLERLPAIALVGSSRKFTA